MIGFFAEFLDGAGTRFDAVPLVHADDQRAPLALDEIGDAKVLFLEWRLRVHQQDDDFGETHRIERIGNRQLLELLLDSGTAP